MKKPLSLLLALSLLLSPVKANPLPSIELSSPSAILIEQETGEILFEKEAHTPLSPASVTKIMTILLIMEGITDGTLHPDDMVYTSSTASSMGGSQVFLSAGESMTVWEMLKCVVVSSANDASVALAEHLCGSESAFVALMNQRAEELGMTNTTFQNATGLPHDHHLTTAYDISLMSRELMFNHPDIQDLTTIWMDTIRGGEFGLSNTNRLIHSYNGATGLKTGSTDSALYCLSATAER
ncbi:MAG: D-alanyl-D-alanine carboxypeptidase family protein, partial [Eubacteriales bacterium]